LGVEHGKTSSPHINQVVSKPQQQGGSGPKIGQSTIERRRKRRRRKTKKKKRMVYI
jgi:hypothetical protein